MITYSTAKSKYREIELSKELCEMSFETISKSNQVAENETCCACDEAVYEVGELIINYNYQ